MWVVVRGKNEKEVWFRVCGEREMRVAEDRTLQYTGNIVYSVWKLCSNYDGHVPGGIRKTWRYIKKDLTAKEAMALYNRTIRRKAKGSQQSRQESSV